MSFFERFTGSNKKVEEEELELSEEEKVNVNINVGTSGAKSASRDLSRKYDYEKLRADVDQDTITMLIRILDKVDTKTQFYTQVEDEGIPLLLLVALGITSEEAIKAYRVLRARGIDTYKAQVSKTQTVDDEYENEILSNTRELPHLLAMDGRALDEPLTSEELYRNEVKTRTSVESELRKTRNRLARLESQEEEIVPDIPYEEKVEQEMVDIGDMFGGDDEEEEITEEQLSGEEFKSWNAEFKKMKENLFESEGTDEYTQVAKELEEASKVDEDLENMSEEDLEELSEEELEALTESKYQAVRSAHKLQELQERDKEIFILSEPFEVESHLDGYKVIFIEEPNDLVLFTASKDNLLVITRAIPLQLVEMFIEWIGSVSSKGINLRAVTLKGMEIEHSFIEGTVELTQESLDNYYEQNKLSKYIGDGVDTFFDIEDSLNEL